MRLQSPFSTVTPTVDGEVLTALSGADRWFTVSQLAELISERSRDGIRKTLARLMVEGVVESMPSGRAGLYRLNRDHVATPAILELSTLRTTFFNRLRETMAAWPHPPVFASLFGSGARGDMNSDSDLDLFLLRPNNSDDQWTGSVESLTEAASRWTGNDVRVLELWVDEARGGESAEPVLADIAIHGITILGDRLAFRRLIRSR